MAGSRTEFHPLTVARVDRLSDDAVAVTFAVPAELAGRVRVPPGQSLTVRRGDERRSYSICAPAGARAADRRARGGRRRGVRLAGPRGPARRRGRGAAAVGLVHPGPGRPRAARADRRGSGITPVLSIAASRAGRARTARASRCCTATAAPTRSCSPTRSPTSRTPTRPGLRWSTCSPASRRRSSCSAAGSTPPAARAAAGHRRRRRRRPLVAVRPVSAWSTDAIGAARRARRAAAGGCTASCSTSRTPRPPRPRTRSRPRARAPRSPSSSTAGRSTTTVPAGTAGARRRPAGPPRPAVRLQGRGVRHLPGPAHRRRGHACAATSPWSRTSSRRATCSPASPCRSPTSVTVDYDA